MTPNEGGPGTLVELDPIDALGWILLDDGRRIRFGGTSLSGFRGLAPIGTRVRVHGLTTGYGGVLKAVRVTPLETAAPSEAASPPAPARISFAELVRRHPRFSDAADVALPCSAQVTAPSLAPHPLFDAWRAEIAATAPTVIDLMVPSYRAPEPIDPGPLDSFAHGRIAYLPTPSWPRCGACTAPLTMCVQLAPEVIAPFVPGGRGLVAMFCFACGVSARSDAAVGYVKLVTPAHRAIGPDTWRDANEKSLSERSRRVHARAARRAMPSSSWLRHRSAHTPDVAASALFGYAPLAFDVPPGADEDMLYDLGAEFDDWLDAQRLPGVWGGARLGGVPSWDQADETPSCAHGEMRLLLDYEGEQFLDGALHVFACPAHACDLAFVAEF